MVTIAEAIAETRPRQKGPRCAVGKLLDLEKLTGDDVETLRDAYRAGRTYGQLAEAVGRAVQGVQLPEGALSRHLQRKCACERDQ